MADTSVHEAMIYTMVITSASDRDMADVELAVIGDVVRTWPVFVGFDQQSLIRVAQDCQQLLSGDVGLNGMLDLIRLAVPERLRDTLYALAVEIAIVDLEIRIEEVRVIQLLRRHLELDPATAGAIERAAVARNRTLN